jgi:hypothetical protein
MSDETKLHAMGVLRRQQSDGAYSLVVRWLLGTGEAMPRWDDRFQVRVLLSKSGSQITRNGNIIASTPEHWIEVKPRNYAMIDPPRVDIELGRGASDEPHFQAVAIPPTAPVDPKAANCGSLRYVKSSFDHGSHAVGVIHILEETEPSRECWRLANILAPAMRKKLLALQEEGRSLQTMSFTKMGVDPIDRSAKSLARFLIQARVRPIDMPKVLELASARFHELAIHGQLAVSGVMPAVFKLDGADFREQLEHAALVTATLNDHELLERLDYERATRQQTRQQLRLRALQGGHLIDFWCSPDTPAGACDDANRGIRYPSAELFGMGLTIPNIAADKVSEWVTENEILMIKVRHDTSGHQPRIETKFVDISVTTPGNIMSGVQVEKFGDGDAPPLIGNNEIKKALESAGSHLPPPPLRAAINYDLTQSNAGHVNLDNRTVTFETGEGKVQILITPPHFEPRKKTVSAFNLYGMWEDEETKRFFRDVPDEPTLDDLQPWRISSRYSYTRDLATAFPSAGVPHHALLEALADPPWFPIQECPERAYEPEPPNPDDPSALPNHHPLPQVGPEGTTATSIDLRKGMSSSFGNPSGVLVKWDAFGRLETEWTPSLRRDGSPAGARPQRYRFWVTSVDPFEQESEPKAVLANDFQAGEPESFIYTPRFRTPLGAPTQRQDGDNWAFKLEFDPSSDKLTTYWETPYAEQVAGDGFLMDTVPRMDKSMLIARVVFFWRRLTRPVELTPQVLMTSLPTFAEDEPQWGAVFETMKQRSFELYQVFDNINPPADGDTWTHDYKLPWADRGFEYVAAVNFRIPDALAAFWAPNITPRSNRDGGRRVMMQDFNGTEFKTSFRHIVELPRCSDVSITDIKPIVNTKQPRAAIGLKASQPSPIATGLEAVFAPAKPVSSPPRISRDLILLRLISHSFKTPKDQTPEVPWLDTDVILSKGQSAMCESAIMRVMDPELNKPDATRLRELRRLLAQEFGKLSPIQNVLAHHSTIGFRGIATFKWRYTPFLSSEPTDRSEAEAVLFRIYQVRVPIGREEATPFATFRGTAVWDAAHNGYRFTRIDAGDVKGIESIANLGQPATARLSQAESDAPQFYGVIRVDLTDPNHPLLSLMEQPHGYPQLPPRAEIMVFGAQPLSEIPVKYYTHEFDYFLDLPVGGGRPEMFFWWVVTVSAQGVEAGPARRPMFSQYGAMSIEPEPPLEFRCDPPTDRTGHELDITNPEHKVFLPSHIDRPDLAHNNPRLLVSWSEPNRSAAREIDAHLVLYRQRQQVSKDESTRGQGLFHGLTVSAWQTIKNINSASPDEVLDSAYITNIEEWLLGNEQIVPDDDDPINSEDLFIGIERGLKSVNGLITLILPSPQGPITRTGFIDYFLDNRNTALAMEGSWIYAYKAERWIDLDPEGRFGLLDDHKYLRSRATEWTPFRLPETPAFQVKSCKIERQKLPPTTPPIVVFEFQAVPCLDRLGIEAFEDPIQFREWYYRIIVRRRIDAGLPVAPGSKFEPMWIEVGQPLILRYGEKEGLVIDAGLDRDEPDREIKPVYQLSITQMAVIENDQKIKVGERLMRHGDAIQIDDLVIPAMERNISGNGKPSLLAEWKIVKKIAII